MGLSASKRANRWLTKSSEFNSACDSAYTHCLSLTQHAFNGLLPYQLLTASDHIHSYLLSHHSPIINRVPTPPTRNQVDSAYRKLTAATHDDSSDDVDVIGSTRFKEWAVVLYVDAAVNNAGKALLSRILIGVVGIAGIGAVTRSPKQLVGTAIGGYALGVACSIYFSLSGGSG